MMHCLGILVGLGLLVASAALAAMSDAVIDDGYARVTVEWAAPVTIAKRAIDAAERNDAIEIRASRSFPADLDVRLTSLKPFVSSARLRDAAMVLELQPAPGVHVETANLDDRTIVIALSAPDALTLGLRLGRHPDFERIVIEPVTEREVALQREAARVTVTLPGRLAARDRDRLERVAGIERVAAAGNQIFLDLAPGAVVKPLFVGPDRQVLDVYVEAPGARAGGDPPQAGATGRSSASEPLGRTLAASPMTTTRTAPMSILPTIDPLPAGDPAGRQVVPVPAAWTLPRLSTLTIDATQQDSDTIELAFSWPEPVPAAVFVRGDQLWVAFAAEHTGITLDSERFGAVARRFVTALREESRPDATLIRIGLVDAPAVGVERDGGVWQIHLTARRFDTVDTPPEVARLFDPAATGLLLPAVEAVAALTDPVVGDNLGIGMALAVTGPTVRPARFVGLRLQPAAQGAVWQQLGESSEVPRWTSAGLYLGPEEGVTRVGTGQRLPAPPEPLLESLPIALDAPDDAPGPPPHAEIDAATSDAAANRTVLAEAPAGSRPIREGPAREADPAEMMREPPAVVGTTGSLRPPEASSPAAAAATRPGPLDLARFRSSPLHSFWDQRSRLLQAAEAAERQNDLVVALELARLHVANGLGPEAVSLLAGLPEPGPLDGPSSDWRALTGAALFLAGRHSAALDHLGHPALQDDGETALWRAATLAALEQWDTALADWQRGEDWLAGYQPVNQAALAEQGIMLLLQTGRIDQALALLEQVMAQPLPAASVERLRELEAMALERDGAIDEARAIWRNLALTGSLDVRSRAVMALTVSDLEAGRIDADAAIDRLLADSVHWRGQSDEIAKRRRLAGVQRAAGYVEDALATLQEALASDPPVALAASVTDDMTTLIEALFDELDAGERSATATLLLYRRYAELMARGPDGDARIGALAMALSELGLDDAAADSIRLRLAQSHSRDAGRAALGYTLASILARRGDDRGAIAALVDSTPIDPIDERLAKARRELVASVGRAGNALTEGSDTPLAKVREQARRAFDRGAWQAVSEATAVIQPALPATGRLDSAATELVLLAATASRQLGADETVEELVAAYGDRLATEGDSAVLRLLASNAHFAGAADDLLGEASSYIRAMREAVAGMPSL